MPAGGDIHYRTKGRNGGQFGVSDIYVTDMLKNVEGLHVICMLPDGYWYKEKKSISFHGRNTKKTVLTS